MHFLFMRGRNCVLPLLLTQPPGKMRLPVAQTSITEGLLKVKWGGADRRPATANREVVLEQLLRQW